MRANLLFVIGDRPCRDAEAAREKFKRRRGPGRRRGMLFSSFAFLLGFLPVSLALYAAVSRWLPAWRLPLLLLESVIFYGWWDWRLLPLLLGSILLNWIAARFFLATGRKLFIAAAIILDLAVLALYKYEGFFAQAAGDIMGLPVPTVALALPLGISFFTFHHVMYLTDLARGRAPRMDLLRYGLYIAFFPQVLAGPLVRWSEILEQFDLAPFRPGWSERISRGLMLLVIGLAKKTLLADALSADVEPIFRMARAGARIAAADAWSAVFGFTFQLYFDFSGYTDMALGIGLMFGIVLPQNFRAPYRTTSIQEFWNSWHMTLARFLRDYVYIPLGGSRHGLARHLAALIGTMVLGGLWHGAGYNFLFWGFLQGAALATGVLWRRARLPMPAVLGWFLTFMFFTLTLVIFHAQTSDEAVRMFRGLVEGRSGGVLHWRTIVLAAAMAMIGPTAFDLVQRLKPSMLNAAVVIVLSILSFLKLGSGETYEFIYFRF